MVMSRSFRKPFVKDDGLGKRNYWRTIRRVQKQYLKEGKDIPPKEVIINDYDYCDYIFDLRNADKEIWNIDKYKRK